MMEIRCSECGYLGAASDVVALVDGVGLVCGECGHVHPMAIGDSADTLGRDGALPDDSSENKVVNDSKNQEKSSFVEESLKRLIPAPGDGSRCRKCLHLIDDSAEHCGRCGLSFLQADAYPDGEAPWEVAPSEKREAYDEGRDLWSAVVDDPTPSAMQSFVDFVIHEEIVDFGIRRIQYFLIHHENNQAALEGLERLARRLEVAVSMARSNAEAKSDEFNEEVKQMRSRLLIGALVFWTVILLLFSWLFWDKL